MTTVAECLAAVEAAVRQSRPPRHRDRAAKFYGSFQWRRLRFVTLAANAERHGGVACCELCGARRCDGARLHVDHIVPLSKDWSRRLDPKNCQILCENDNLGKMNRSTTDWRPAIAAVDVSSAVPRDACKEATP
jgi:5-methylcytosine-specific restriction endonuclease McrA